MAKPNNTTEQWIQYQRVIPLNFGKKSKNQFLTKLKK